MARAGFLADPNTFREIVLADLYRGQRLVEKVHPDPIDPQFRIAMPSPAISISRSDASRSGFPGDREQCGAGGDGAVGWCW